MDKKEIIENLYKVFCNSKKEGKVYSEVWLCDEDFGGLYHSGSYVLNVRVNHQIDDCSDEIKEIVEMLAEKAKSEFSFISRVDVYSEDENIHCSSEDIRVYADEGSCP